MIIIVALSRKAEPWCVFFHLGQAITDSSTSEGRYNVPGRGAKRENERGWRNVGNDVVCLLIELALYSLTHSTQEFYTESV